MDTKFREYYNKLNEISEYFKEIGFETKLYDVQEEIPVPTLAIAIKEDYKGEPQEIDMLITPFLEDTAPNTQFIQISSPLNLSVNNENISDLLIILNKINSINLLGYFVVLGDTVCYKYTCPVPKSLNITNDSFIEAFTILSILISNFNELICKTASGIYTLSEAMEKLDNI